MVEYGRRSGRAAARRAAAALERTPKNLDPAEDEVMADAADETHNGDDDDEHKPENEPENDDAQENNDTADDADASGVASAAASAAASPAPVMMIRRKRLGRPPKNRPPDWDGMVEVPMSESEIAAAQAAAAAKERGEVGTPKRRGRGGWRGRGGRKGDRQDGHGGGGPQQQVIDKDGNVVDIINDELDLPEDPAGETKVDKDGNLQGGREYRCRTFTVAGRGTRLYMLSTEPARCVGFRDSYLFFTKHKRLYKIIVGDDEKRDMIEREIIPHSYKGRAIGIVTARSVFREFGALIIVGGRRVTDDYTLANEEEGAPPVVEGALADPNDHFVPGEPYNKNQYVAWHGASAVYHAAGGPAGGVGAGGAGGAGGAAGGGAASQALYKAAADAKKRRVAVNDFNWQLEHAREASSFNSMLTAARGTTLEGVYDIHTNVMQYPASMQPQRARAVLVEDESQEEPTNTFPVLSPLVARNFYVADIHLETPPAGIAPAAYDRYRIDADNSSNSKKSDFLAPFQGLGSVSDDIRDLLPDECRAAFDAAVDKEQKWFGKWGDEQSSMSRREPVIDKAIVPYAMML